MSDYKTLSVVAEVVDMDNHLWRYFYSLHICNLMGIAFIHVAVCYNVIRCENEWCKETEEILLLPG